MRSVYCVVVVAVAVVASTAAADPITFEVKGEVPVGQKPQLRITAAEPVTDVRVDLERDDGKHFALRQGKLAKGQAVTLAIGDGSAGKRTYKGTLSAVAGGPGRWTQTIEIPTFVRAPITIGYDADHLDVDKHVLQFTLSQPPASAELVAIGEDGRDLGTGSATYPHATAGTWVAIEWTQPASERVLKLRLHAIAANGLESTVELIPWSVTVDHEDVSFATDSAVIEHGEEPKLDASLAKMLEIEQRSGRFVKMQLYVAGHTDTVGPAAKNRTLSLARARAIATYLRAKGFALPIVVAGFGEDVLKVKTPDETDERANRRVDYVLGPAGGAPPFRGAYAKVHADWHPVR